MQEVAPSQTAMQEIVNSQAAMQEVANSRTAMNELLNENSAVESAISNTLLNSNLAQSELSSSNLAERVNVSTNDLEDSPPSFNSTVILVDTSAPSINGDGVDGSNNYFINTDVGGDKLVKANAFGFNASNDGREGDFTSKKIIRKK
jgi:hypothetical protein